MKSRTANSGLAKVAVQCSADTFVVNQTLVLRINIYGKNRHLRQAAKRYRKPYDDSANTKLTDMKPNICDNIRQQLTSQRKEVLFFANADFLFFNFIATTHCTHLSLHANTQAHPKAKSKECNFQRSNSYI